VSLQKEACSLNLMVRKAFSFIWDIRRCPVSSTAQKALLKQRLRQPILGMQKGALLPAYTLMSQIKEIS